MEGNGDIWPGGEKKIAVTTFLRAEKSLDLRNMGKLSHLSHIPQNQTHLFTEVPFGWAGPGEAVTHGCFLEGSFSTANCSDGES